jgi:hypothetical protein
MAAQQFPQDRARTRALSAAAIGRTVRVRSLPQLRPVCDDACLTRRGCGSAIASSSCRLPTMRATGAGHARSSVTVGLRGASGSLLSDLGEEVE